MKKNKNIVAFTKYGTMSASVRHRYLAYSNYLSQQHLNLIILPLFDNKYFQKKILQGRSAWPEIFLCYFKRFLQVCSIKKPSCAIVHTEMTPYLPGILEFILKIRRIPYIVDIDDALFHQYDKHPNIIIRTLLSKKIGRIMKYSTAVFAGNEYIASYARKWNAQQVEIVPTVIDMERYINQKKVNKEDVFTIVWIGSPTTTRYLLDIVPALAKICKDNKARIRLIGAKKIELSGISDDSIDFFQWSEDNEVDLIRACHVGIMPLPDTNWEKGKCGFKLLQYMGCDLPIVASPVGVNAKIVEHGINGYLASSTQEWINALEILYDQPNTAHKMGIEARRKVDKEYSLHIWGPHYTKLVKKVINDNG